MGAFNTPKQKKGALHYVVIIVAVLLFLGLFGSCFGSNSKSRSPEASTPSSAGESVSLSKVKLSPTTEYLEYSSKEVDPLKLVSGAVGGITVATNGKIDLSKVGIQKVEYKLSLGDESALQVIEFTVRDTKSPTIELSDSKPSIDQGGSFDPQASISKVSDPVDGDLPRVDSAPAARGERAGLEQFYDNGWYVVEGGVDSGTPGTYSLTVKASDKHGNTATREIPVTVREVAQAADEPAPAPAQYTYIVNVKSRKFHVPDCNDVKKMKDSNKAEITATRQEMIDMGYSPCGHCKP